METTGVLTNDRNSIDGSNTCQSSLHHAGSTWLAKRKPRPFRSVTSMFAVPELRAIASLGASVSVATSSCALYSNILSAPSPPRPPPRFTTGSSSASFDSQMKIIWRRVGRPARSPPLGMVSCPHTALLYLIFFALLSSPFYSPSYPILRPLTKGYDLCGVARATERPGSPRPGCDTSWGPSRNYERASIYPLSDLRGEETRALQREVFLLATDTREDGESTIVQLQRTTSGHNANTDTF